MRLARLFRPRHAHEALTASLRATRWLAIGLGIVAGWLVSAGPALATLGTTPTSTYATDGPVYSVVRDGSTLYLGGDFEHVAPITGQVAEFAAGATQPTAGFPRFTGGDINTIIPDGSGGWFVGGAFTHVNGVARFGLAHVLANDTVDASFPALTDTVGSFEIPEPQVDALAMSGSTLYVGGAFREIGGTERRGLAAVTVATGAVASWNPAPATIAGTFDFPGRIQALAVDGTDLYVGGGFNRIAGQERGGLAEIDLSTGSPTAWSPGATGGGQGPLALATSATQVYVAGHFSSIAGSDRKGAASISRTTGAVGSWDPQLSAGAQPSSVLVSGSTVYLAGAFTSASGQARDAVAAVDATTGAPLAFDPDLDQKHVQGLAMADSDLVIVGGFRMVGGAAHSGVAALDPVTGAVRSWSPQARIGRSFSSVDAIAATATSVVVGGDFVSVGGVARSNLAAVDATTGAPTAWNPNVGPDDSGKVHALARAGSTLYIGGDFASVGGAPRRRLAAVSTATGSVTSWEPIASTGPAPSSAFATVHTLAVDDERVYFPRYDLSSLKIASASRATGAVTDLSGPIASSGSPGTGQVWTMERSGARLFFGGAFESVGGQPRTNLAALNLPDGALLSWRADATGGSNPVRDLEAGGDRLYVTGQFGQIGDQPRNGLADLSVATGAVSEWTPLGGFSSNAIAVRDHSVISGGAQTRAHDRLTGDLLGWETTIPTWAIGASSDRLVIGSYESAFTVGGQPAGGFTILPITAPEALARPTVSGTVRVGSTLTATSGTWTGSPSSFSYQWQACNPGCGDISGATSRDYTIPTTGQDGTRFRARVRAVAGGITSDPMTTLQTAAALVMPPGPQASPTLSGTPRLGQTLSCAPGTWSGNPTSFAYTWRRDGALIAGQTGSAYTVQPSDVAASLNCEVAATNAGGTSATLSSNSVDIEAAEDPAGPGPGPADPGAPGTPPAGQPSSPAADTGAASPPLAPTGPSAPPAQPPSAGAALRKALRALTSRPPTLRRLAKVRPCACGLPHRRPEPRPCRSTRGGAEHSRSSSHQEGGRSKPPRLVRFKHPSTRRASAGPAASERRRS